MMACFSISKWAGSKADKKYLESMEVGSREGVKEKELEWQRKNDIEGEDNLTD